jgi:hypothetical protein
MPDKRVVTKRQVLAAANKFGFVLDESVSGQIGYSASATFDHPTHSIGGDCRSICVDGGWHSIMSDVWPEALDRILAEGPLLTPCETPDCDYHNEEDS